MKYTQLHISFLNEFPKGLESYLLKTGKFLECMLNSKMFEKFVLEGKYTNRENEKGLSNAEIYGLLKAQDWNIDFYFRSDDVSGDSAMSEIDGMVTVRDFVKNYPISKSAAITAHEYGHVLGLDHKRGKQPYRSFSSYLQYEGEKLFRKYEGKVSEPQKGKMLIERKRGFPLCWRKRLEWK